MEGSKTVEYKFAVEGDGKDKEKDEDEEEEYTREREPRGSAGSDGRGEDLSERERYRQGETPVRYIESRRYLRSGAPSPTGSEQGPPAADDIAPRRLLDLDRIILVSADKFKPEMERATFRHEASPNGSTGTRGPTVSTLKAIGSGVTVRFDFEKRAIRYLDAWHDRIDDKPLGNYRELFENLRKMSSHDLSSPTDDENQVAHLTFSNFRLLLHPMAEDPSLGLNLAEGGWRAHWRPTPHVDYVYYISRRREDGEIEVVHLMGMEVKTVHSAQDDSTVKGIALLQAKTPNDEPFRLLVTTPDPGAGDVDGEGEDNQPETDRDGKGKGKGKMTAAKAAVLRSKRSLEALAALPRQASAVLRKVVSRRNLSRPRSPNQPSPSPGPPIEDPAPPAQPPASYATRSKSDNRAMTTSEFMEKSMVFRLAQNVEYLLLERLGAVATPHIMNWNAETFWFCYRVGETEVSVSKLYRWDEIGVFDIFCAHSHAAVTGNALVWGA